MNNFIHAIDGFNQSKVYYTDTDSLFIDGDSLNILKEKGLYGLLMGQGKNDLSQSIKFEGGIKTIEKINELKLNNNPLFSKYLNESDKSLYGLKFEFKCDPEIQEAYFLGPKQKWIKTKCPLTGLEFDHITLKGIPNCINKKNINEDGTINIDKIHIEDVFSLDNFKSLIESQRTGDKLQYTINFDN